MIVTIEQTWVMIINKEQLLIEIIFDTVHLRKARVQ